jgi:hypothetical protein
MCDDDAGSVIEGSANGPGDSCEHPHGSCLPWSAVEIRAGNVRDVGGEDAIVSLLRPIARGER